MACHLDVQNVSILPISVGTLGSLVRRRRFTYTEVRTDNFVPRIDIEFVKEKPVGLHHTVNINASAQQDLKTDPFCILSMYHAQRWLANMFRLCIVSDRSFGSSYFNKEVPRSRDVLAHGWNQTPEPLLYESLAYSDLG